MKYDLIIVACSSSPRLIQITQDCINSALQDEADLNIIIVETFRETIYKNVNKVVNYEGQFNYNRALNQGLKYVKGDIHILSNNDVIFHKGWSTIGTDMQVNGFDSASAREGHRHRNFQPGNWIYEGYGIGIHVAGWCIFITKEAMQKIDRLDDRFEFWYSDNAYADQLIEHGLRHGLFCNVQVDHIVSATFRTKTKYEMMRYSMGSTADYKKYKMLRHASREANN